MPFSRGMGGASQKVLGQAGRKMVDELYGDVRRCVCNHDVRNWLPEGSKSFQLSSPAVSVANTKGRRFGFAACPSLSCRTGQDQTVRLPEIARLKLMVDATIKKRVSSVQEKHFRAADPLVKVDPKPVGQTWLQMWCSHRGLVIYTTTRTGACRTLGS